MYIYVYLYTSVAISAQASSHDIYWTIICYLAMCILSVVLSFAFVGLADAWHEPLLKGMKIPQTQLGAAEQQASLRSRKALQAKSSGRRHIETNCAICPGKDYSETCPSGWQATADGMCNAPTEYTGVCNTQQSFALLSGIEKEEVELICNVCWTCECERDWALPCPSGYVLIATNGSDVTCSADVGYNGQCEPVVAFKGVEDKHAFAERCFTSWQCKLPSSFAAQRAALGVASNGFDYPQLNLHVGEPRDLITHDDQRSRRHELLELEKQESADRTYLASAMASQASMLTKMFDIVESIRSVA